jgi:hypothetical protein
MGKLVELLDFGKLNNFNEVYEHFYKVSAELFYAHEIHNSKGDKFVITDVELYFHNSDFCEDPFMGSRHHTQLTNGRFYIHRNSKNNHSFKKPSYVGLDFTCGNYNGCFGGLLIKAIKNVKTGEEIIGSAKVLNTLIGTKKNESLREKSWSNSELLKLYEIDDVNIFKNKIITLKLLTKRQENSEIYIGKRENLKKVDSPKKLKFESVKFKAVSNLSDRKKDKYELYQSLVEKNLKAA